MPGELPNRVYVPQLNESVPLFPDKASIPQDYYARHIAILESGVPSNDIANGVGVAYLTGPAPGSAPLYAGVGEEYPGAWPVLTAALIALITRLVLIIAAVVVICIVASMYLAPLKQDLGNGSYIVCAPAYGCVMIDPSGNATHVEDTGGLGDLAGQVVGAGIIIAGVAAGAYIIMKVIVPGFSASQSMSRASTAARGVYKEWF